MPFVLNHANGEGDTPGIVDARTVLMIGDSIGTGLRGEVTNGLGHGGARPFCQLVPNPNGQAQTKVNYVGSFTDPAGYKHSCVGGSTFAAVTAAFPAFWAANPAQEVWIFGTGINDAIAGFTGTQITANARTCIEAVRAEVLANPLPSGAPVVIRLVGPPPVNNAGQDVVLLDYIGRAPNMVDEENVDGPVAWVRGGGELWTRAAAPAVITQALDGIIIEHPRDRLGYETMGGQTWQHISGGNSLAPPNCGGVIQGWWSADQVTLNVGGEITAFTDKSGNARTATQTVVGVGATPTTLFSRPAALYAGGAGSIYRTAAFGALANTYMLAIVGQAGNATGCIYDSANAAARNALFGSGGPNTLSVFAGATVNVNINPQTRPHALLVRWAANAQQIFWNDQWFSIINAGAQSMDGVTIGATVASTLPFAGILSDIVLMTGNVDVYGLNQWVKSYFPGVVPLFR